MTLPASLQVPKRFTMSYQIDHFLHFSLVEPPPNVRHVPTRSEPNYKNLFTHARRHTLKSAALGVGHHAVVRALFEWKTTPTLCIKYTLGLSSRDYFMKIGKENAAKPNHLVPAIFDACTGPYFLVSTMDLGYKYGVILLGTLVIR